VIERLLDTSTWDDVALALALEEGLADARAGRLVDGGCVLRWLESWSTDHELPPPSLIGGSAVHLARAG